MTAVRYSLPGLRMISGSDTAATPSLADSEVRPLLRGIRRRAPTYRLFFCTLAKPAYRRLCSMLLLAITLPSMVVAVPTPGSSDAQHSSVSSVSSASLSEYSPIPGGTACNHTVYPDVVVDSCPERAVLPNCTAQEPETKDGLFVYICPPLEGETPYCNTPYSFIESKFATDCTRRFDFGSECSESVDNGVFRYGCPWDPASYSVAIPSSALQNGR